jgi:hypothetical protein
MIESIASDSPIIKAEGDNGDYKEARGKFTDTIEDDPFQRQTDAVVLSHSKPG